MNDWLSNKFKWLSFVATWAVVGIHAWNGKWVAEVDWATRVEDLIPFDFAVPLFFVISGFFFVSSYDKCANGGGGTSFCGRFARFMFLPYFGFW